ncbi:uncharacterized protein M6B38_413005 [Iris pallida]|uniref:DUF7794 domain-containing protein n=1 Tax=Iris pallida TaxID=29817 RepID=A0AAX6FLA7_IRIPA|nr:uncharacterized protein M6B38_413005 [Iris pallida]
MATKLNLLIFLCMLVLQSRAEISGSVVFLDAPGHSFFRSRPSEIDGEEKPLSTNEVAATISVLLGSAPPASLSADSSAKLNEVLFPNPFDRPSAVFLLEVVGINDPLLPIVYSNGKVGSTFSSSVIDSDRASIQLTDEDEVSVTYIDGPLCDKCDAAYVEKELSDLAQWLEGTYIGSPDSLDGKLSFSLSSDSSFNLQMSKESDRHFALSLVALRKNIKKTVEFNEDFTGNSMSTAELLIGQFTGIEALKEEYGSGHTVQQGMELLKATLTKSFELLQKSHGGKIVGVLLSNSKPNPELGAMIDVKISARESRWLEEAKLPNATTIAEVILVRRSLALITGIILLVSTLIGISEQLPRIYRVSSPMVTTRRNPGQEWVFLFCFTHLYVNLFF